MINSKVRNSVLFLSIGRMLYFSLFFRVSFVKQFIITSLNNCTAKSEVSKLKEDVERMSKEKGEICSRLLENQRKIASLENDSSTLTQVTS